MAEQEKPVHVMSPAQQANLFKPGQSGNPKGRPKKEDMLVRSLNDLSEIIQIELNDDIVTKTGVKMTAIEGIIKKSIQSVLNGGKDSAASRKWLTEHGFGLLLQRIDHTTKGQAISALPTSQVESNINRLLLDMLTFCSKAGIVCPVFAKERYINAEGGRGGGKSESLGARFVVWYAANALNTKVLCGREMQNSIKDSVKSMLDRIIEQYELQSIFVSTDTKIICTLTNTEIIFIGLRSATRTTDGLKALDNVSLVWGEEAQAFSQITIDKLDPTIRVDRVEMRDGSFRSSQFIFTYNRQLDSDPIHTYYVESKMENVLHIKINYYQNPYLPNVLKVQAETMKVSNYMKWLHVWFGEPQKYFEDSLWVGDLVNKMRKNVSFDRSNYTKVVVAVDPAQTNKEYSNEYGITVEGLTFNNEGHVIADVSSKHTPNSFATTAIKAYYEFMADAMIVEINAGGDFIKSTILSIDPKINVIEVRAIQDKNKRAIPVANLAQMGKIFHICGGFPKLESQMQRMTTRGFEGAPGESPDRLDAMVHGFVHLFNLGEIETTELVFKQSMFNKPKFEYDMVLANCVYVGFDGDCYGLLLTDVIRTKNDQKVKFLVKDYNKDRKENVIEYLENLLKTNTISEMNIPDDVTGTPIITNLASKFVGVKPISTENYISKAIAERVIQIIPHIQIGQVCVVESLPIKQYNNIHGDLFTKEICSYNPDQKIDQPIIAALANMVMLENDIRSI